MFNKPNGMSRADMEEMLRLAESFTSPYLEKLEDLSDIERRNGVVKLIMALGFGIAMVQLSFFPFTNPDEFVKHLGNYISETVKKLKLAEEESKNGKSAANHARRSVWDA